MKHLGLTVPAGSLRRSEWVCRGAVAGVLTTLLGVFCPGAWAGNPVSTPAVFEPFVGDPRLEPLPAGPVHLANFDVFANGRLVKMHFLPRVNGQTQADGDHHADLFVLIDRITGLPFDQPSIVEAVPLGAVQQPVGEFTARHYSAVWEIHAVWVAHSYDPTDPSQLIDSAAKLFSSPLVKRIFQTNMFLNCPIVPLGSTVDPEFPTPLLESFFNGEKILIAPYDIEDGRFNPQVMFKFHDESGNVLDASGSPLASAADGNPHLVASFAPGDPFYSSTWEIWTVVVPNADLGTVGDIKSAQDVRDRGYAIESSGIRLNCPVVAIQQNDGSFVPFPFEDAFAMLLNDHGVFNPRNFLFKLPDARFTRSRTFLLTETGPAIPVALDLALIADFPGALPAFPLVASSIKGNPVPIVLQNPLGIGGTGPNQGAIRRFTQSDLDAGMAMNPPRLPEPIEQNIQDLVDLGILSTTYLPGFLPYHERLALVGRALFELVWSPEQGGNQLDTTSCMACHSAPTGGGGGRGLYTLERRNPDGSLKSRVNPGSLFGLGAAQLLRQGATGADDDTHAVGSLGNVATVRQMTNNALVNHTGLQSTEKVVELGGAADTIAAGAIDLDGDGVMNELSVGEVTALTAFVLSLPVPDQAAAAMAFRIAGTTMPAARRGRQLFSAAVQDGGAGCASCHRPFWPLASTVLQLDNPETGSVIPIPVSHHFANDLDIAEGWATTLNEPGIRVYGDFMRHKMGPLMKGAGSDGTDFLKTAEIWDVGSTVPFLRDGSINLDLAAVILAHEGLDLPGIALRRSSQVDLAGGITCQTITFTNTTALPVAASPAEPIRIILRTLSPGLTPLNADEAAPDGSFRSGANWHITQTLLPGASVDVEFKFANPGGLRLRPSAFTLTIQDHVGYSEAAFAAKAFRRLAANQQSDLIGFLRAQLIGDLVGE